MGLPNKQLTVRAFGLDGDGGVERIVQILSIAGTPPGPKTNGKAPANGQSL